MNYTILSSVSYLLALQKILKFRISVELSEVLVRSFNLHLRFIKRLSDLLKYLKIN